MPEADRAALEEKKTALEEEVVLLHDDQYLMVLAGKISA